MQHQRVLIALAALIAAPVIARPSVAAAQATTAVPAKLLRICADPDDLPFSNDKREGFDNKIAALIASDLGDSLSFTWWPTRRGFVRNTLRAGECDVVIGVPKGYDLVAASDPYYRAAYYVVTRRDRHLAIRSLDDSVIRSLKIGVNMMGDDYANTPPGQALSARGLGANLVGYHTFYDNENRPGDIVDAVAAGKIDAAVVWGPIAGYYAKRSAVPLDLVALPDSDSVTGFPFAYDEVMGVRRGDREHLSQLNGVIARRKAEIAQILRDYGIPTATAPGTAASSSK